MGGFMGTPPAPAQPPQVNFTTTAESRGGFNNFLRSIPSTTAMTPIPPMGSSLMPPMANPMNNIDIFNQPSGMMGMNQPQMNPMMQQPMQAPMNMGVGLMGTPVQSFFDGGQVDDFGDFSSVGDDAPSVDNDDGFSFSDDTVGDTSAGGFTVGDTEDRSQSDNFQSALDNITLGSDNSMFSNDPASATPMGLSYPSGQNFGNRPTINANDLNLLKSEINNRNEISLTEEDSFFNKDGSMKQSGIDELNKRNAADLQLVQAGDIPVSNYISSGNVLDNLDLSKGLALDKDTIDPFDIQPTFQNFGLSGANLPNVDSPRSTVVQDQVKAIANLVGDRDQTIGEKLQQNILEERGRALGPTTFSDDLAGGTGRSEPFSGPDLDANRSRGTRNIDDEASFLPEIPDAAKIFGGRKISNLPTGSTTTRPEDFEENVGRKFDADRMADIERLYNINVGQAGLGTGKDKNFIDSSKGTEPTFLEGLGLPSILSAIDPGKRSRESMANEIALGRPMGLGETFFGFDAGTMAVDDKGRALVGDPQGTGRFTKVSPSTTTKPMTMEDYMANTQKNILNEAGDSETVSRRLPENQLIRNDSGRVIGIKNASGRLVSGMDPNAPMDTGNDNNENPLILRPIAKAEEEKVEEEKLPNVIGGGVLPSTPTPKSVVVDSPFTSNVGNFIPSSFNTGELNKLIEALTGVPAPRNAIGRPVPMQDGGVAGYAEGGLINAVDNFLASV